MKIKEEFVKVVKELCRQREENLNYCDNKTGDSIDLVVNGRK